MGDRWSWSLASFGQGLRNLERCSCLLVGALWPVRLQERERRERWRKEVKIVYLGKDFLGVLGAAAARCHTMALQSITPRISRLSGVHFEVAIGTLKSRVNLSVD